MGIKQQWCCGGMMDSITELFERLLALVLGSATLYGAGGAFMHARRKGKPLRQTVIEVMGGAITTNMLSPIVQEFTPEKWHYTLFFLIGWGGLELVGRLYEATVSAVENRIRRKIGDE